MSDKNIIHMAVLLTCFNRVEKTLSCLKNLYNQDFSCDVEIKVYLVDDGSTDETGEKVKNNFPDVTVLTGDGSLFWNGGMHKAFGAALEDGFDYYLWLNDDTFLHDGALDALINTHLELARNGKEKSVVITATRDPDNGGFSYSGYKHTRKILNPLDLTLIPPSDKPIECDTYCGNVVLIPKQVADIVGNINPVYKHRWGDVDYGLRAKKLGCHGWIAAGMLADCDTNPNADRWRLTELSFAEKIKELHSLKGIGKKDWYQYTKLHGGIMWPLAWVRPYLRVVYDSMFRS